MACAYCGRPTPKEWVKYCSAQCRADSNNLSYLERKRQKLQDKAKVKPH